MTKLQRIYWTSLEYGADRLVVAASDKGLCYVGAWNQPIEDVIVATNTRFPASRWVEDDEKLKPYTEELEQYMEGARTDFTVPIDLQGTPFQKQVWEAMSKVPYGRTASYADIATELNRSSAVRAVGTAIGRNPVLIVVPCHRIIGKNGSLTGYRGGLPMKEQLLRLEGSVR
jgi:methylated-DNA-[protein]-cysteine S-methyltransferase